MIRYLTLFIIFLVFIRTNTAGNYKEDFKIVRRSLINNPFKLLGKCISDHECKPIEYCDHNGINPIGSCKVGKESDKSCLLDRYCQSKNCHHLKCVARKPVKDGNKINKLFIFFNSTLTKINLKGPCVKDQHTDCLEDQYCSKKDNEYRCKDRRCSGVCIKDAHCLSNNCRFLICKKPDTGCTDKNNK
jgi:hypothetical protein